MVCVLAISIAAGSSLAPAAAMVDRSTAARPALQQSSSVAARPGPADQAAAYYQFLRGRLLEAADDVGQALAAYQEALRLDPSSAEVHAALAALHARQNRAREAIDFAEKALAIDAANIEGNRVLGLIYASFADSEEESSPKGLEYAKRAVKHLEVIAKAAVFPDPGLLLALGRLATRTGAYETAISALTRLADQVPDSAEVQGMIAEAEAGAGRTGAAIERLEKAAARDPRQYPALAELYRRERRWSDAVAVYEKVAAGDPRNLEAKVNLAEALLNLEDPLRTVEARDLLKAVLASRPEDAQALYLLAMALEELGDLDEAEATARRLVGARPEVPFAHAALAQLLSSRGAYDRALEVLREAEKKFPSNVTIMFQTGAVLEQAGRHEDAEREFKKVLERDPLHAPSLNYLGYMLADRGERLEESVDYIKRALAIEPENAAYLDSLGWAYFKLKRLDLAEPPLRKAAGERKSDSVVQDHFARLLFEMGRYQEAISAWERALAGNGQDIDRKAIEAAIRAAREKLPRR
ncbi:MAG: tetratricopeptide repeat protein [Vicinamibacterales bacterium]